MHTKEKKNTKNFFLAHNFHTQANYAKYHNKIAMGHKNRNQAQNTNTMNGDVKHLK